VVHVGYWGQHGRCYGEGCSHGTHCLMLTELGCYCGHSLPYAHRTWLLLRAHPSHCTLSRTTLTRCGRLIWMRWAMSFRFTTTVAGHTWPDMPSTYSSYSMTHSGSLRSSDTALLDMLRKSRTSPRRLVTRPRRLVLCVSMSETWRVAFATKRRHF
jgi:hypothetical protein